MGVLIGVAVGGSAVLCTLLCVAMSRAGARYDRMEERAWQEKVQGKETDGR